MDLKKCVWILCAVVFACLLATCSVYAQLDESKDADDVMEYLQPNDKRGWRVSAYDPEYDWSKVETNRNNDNTLVSFLKRGVADLSDSYKRHSRFQQIIPFYSYGRNGGRISGFDSVPGYTQPAWRRPVPFSSWSRKVQYPTYRFSRRPVYDKIYRPVFKF